MQQRSVSSTKDRFHAAVRIAQELEQWKITDDPLRLEVGGTKFEIDLGTEQLLAAERDLEKIASSLAMRQIPCT